MGEPWLDSLSEDWASEPRLSSPASSLLNSRHGTHNSRASQSRIPHLAHSMRQTSSGSSFLKPRSSRGIAKSRGIPILSERSASTLNLPSNQITDGSMRRSSTIALPRKTSSNFSGSQTSVQRHEIDESLQETPEWKKRIQNGEEIASDGFDLFSPSKLEGMFAQPAQLSSDQENQSPINTNESKPWTSLKFSNTQQPTEQYQSFRTSRSRAPPMASLPELNEDEEDSLNHSMSAISSELVRGGSMHGLVKRRVSDLERSHEASSPLRSSTTDASPDHRWRTLSGQQELRNEIISPITASTKNTIKEKALQESVELDPKMLREKLLSVDSQHPRRPSSRSSDRDVSYNGQGGREESMLHDEIACDMTSHSLPEDLSMGTQDYVSHRGFVNTRRGQASQDTSFFRRKLSSLDESWIDPEDHASANKFHSSPPPYTNKSNKTASEDQEIDGSQTEDQDGSVIHHETSPIRPTSAGSPLKLFGNRDTYTNNKLLRVLSQYEQDGSDNSGILEEELDATRRNSISDVGLRMSQFGKGELDTYNFEKEVKRPSPVEEPVYADHEKIFQSLIDLSIDDEGTIAGVRPLAPAIFDEQSATDVNVKRLPSSPGKERTTKRRRTLVHEEVVVDGVDIEVKIDHLQGRNSIAGQKRKDTKPAEDVTTANPSVLASRSILQPRQGSRKSSGDSQDRNSLQDSTIKRDGPPRELTEALAAELASFTQGAADALKDSRKPSLATRDYMEEANKVMEFIRARGKPKSRLPEIQEPIDTSILDADRILDLEIEDDSTMEPFSRPPSREGPVKPREDRRIAHHDSQTADHLQKFKDSDELELLASVSVVGTLHLVDNAAASEAALVPVPSDKQESSPPNIRIRNESDTLRKRKHSASTNGGRTNTARSISDSAQGTLDTDSTNNSAQKGMITSGKVTIPDTVGTMTFDHEKQIWVKQQLAKAQRKRSQSQRSIRGGHDDATLDDDPFEDIPDLSIDEQHEAAMRAIPRSSSRPSTAETVLRVSSRQSDHQAVDGFGGEEEVVDDDQRHESITSNSELAGYANPKSSQDDSPPKKVVPSTATSKHEERLHLGIPSQEPAISANHSMQPRVVTIAFSSPIASEIPLRKADLSAPPPDDEDLLPPDDSDEDDIEYLRTPQPSVKRKDAIPVQSREPVSADQKNQPRNSIGFERRPVSRIEERDEEGEHDEGLSLIRIKQQPLKTPNQIGKVGSAKPASAYKGTSILCLTPLSEFTMHQVDKANHPEESFVQERAHPKALLQAHGSLALAVDTLVKAITDAVPNEPFWEQIRNLNLKDSRLQSLHGLQDYCSGLEGLDISHNQVVQLDGLPGSLRQLDASHNKINDFTSWGHLQNLQYVDVSNNQLENLEGFSSLVHMRKLRCCSNKIQDIEGILDLDGLLSLELQDNGLKEIDFEGVDLPRLKELNLSSNKLTTIRNLHYLPELKHLNLSDNSLRELFISEPLTNLKSLIIASNELESLDLNMFPALTKLDLDGNCIKRLRGLPDASQLRQISVRNQRDSTDIINFILTTPNECNEICLSSNVLVHGQMKLPKYPHYNLRHLELAACGLQSLPVGFGDYFPNCRSLNLNFNAVSEISSLLGSIKLQRLFIAGNRIKRLRRTCLTLSRMPVLQRVDLRNNPLTVGFYSPDQGNERTDESYMLPKRSTTKDLRWLEVLDETTGLKRKMIELLLAENCLSLKELDGLPFNQEKAKEQDTLWKSLTSKGVLTRTIEAPPQEKQVLSAAEMPFQKICEDKGASQGNDDNDNDVNAFGLALERSVIIE